MTGVLLLCSAVLVLVAAAIELWWGAARRERQRASLQHTEQRLAAALPVTQLAGMSPRAPAAAPAAPAPAALPWDALLQRAGLRGGWTLPLVWLVSGLLLAWLAAARIGTAWMWPITLALFALVLGVWLSRRILGLQRRLLRQLPDFLDNLVRLTALGNSLQMAFQTASQQVPAPLRGLLDDTLSGARSGLDLDRALSQASRPYRLEVLDVLAVVLGVSIRIGGRSDQILQRMSDFMRDLEQAQQELMATTSETRMSAWVLGLLPPLCALLMAIASPDFFQPVLHAPLGHKLLGAALLLELIGGFLLYRLARSL
ncbi:type II secretion system F family protein [Stenotrophomonas oahuensis]|uniref:Type II secretion system F family protein n=1 Tax=Stenotrophomonas oahuensis TaxID=3003271 RepID=A0ABY9YNA8_9GAMM|nr:type II secretion system F family protein [Stenotrophomonas sp. A5586]WNH52356.1 type II secretion system F family protein [Stenotrophomonas sp. A5586]